MKRLLILILITIYFISFSQNNLPKKIYILNIAEEIGPKAWRNTQKAFENATKLNSDIILIHINTYGGLVDMADSIRTKILNSKIPVWAFIDNNAASAGALISIACDSIYMREGARIGAATVVTQDGEKAPDKYQAYMRATMRATAESKGKDTIILGSDTIIRWRRDPKIAEAMVDESIFIDGIIDSTKILTFTTNEAIENNYCEGKSENIAGVFKLVKINNYKINEYTPSFLEKIIGWLINPIISGLLIMLIVGGIYFELQSPGIGFPLFAAITAAILYFAPLYLEGLAQNWEILIFIVGIILIGLEIFVVPGFGITGISGIILIVAALTLSLITNNIFEYNSFNFAFKKIFEAFSLVVISLSFSFIFSIIFGKKLLLNTSLNKFILKQEETIEDGYSSIKIEKLNIIGKTGITLTDLRLSGKVIIDNEIYDAMSEYEFISKNEQIIVTRLKTGQVYVKKNN